MSVSAENTPDGGAPARPRLDARSMRNVAALFTANAILGSQLVINMTFGPLVGAMLAADPSWATAPITVMVVACMLTTAPASALMGRVGRRPGFLLGVAFGALGGALGAYAIVVGSFPLFLIATACLGVYQAHQNLFRFAAADTCSDAAKPTAISWVLGGGLVAALLAPTVAATFKDALAPIPMAGAYLAIVGLNGLGVFAILALDIPKPPQRKRGETAGRPLREILAQPVTRVAIFCGMISYALMSLVMTAASIAVVGCGYSASTAGAVIGAHVFAMYGPSFFTGFLITRFGHSVIISIGLLLLAACGIVAVSGVEIERFFIALILLGLGWNFAFIGATSLLATSHSVEERSKIQGFNDFCVFGLVALASLGSGKLFHAGGGAEAGWAFVNMAMTPFLVAAALALAWLAAKTAEPRAALR